MFTVHCGHLTVTNVRELNTPNIEAIWLKVTSKSFSFALGLIYRPPWDNDFFEHLQTPLERAWLKYKNLLLVGDFNTNYANEDDPRLQPVFTQYGLQVINKDPTRVMANSSTLIDLVVTNMPRRVVSNTTIDLGLSDHSLVYTRLNMKVQRPKPKIITTRDYSRLQSEEFKQDLEAAPWSVISCFDDPDDVYFAWREIFMDVCNKHAPVKSVKLRAKSLPWITGRLRHKMNERYKLLRLAKRTKDSNLQRRYRQARNEVTTELRRAKAEYFATMSNEVTDCRKYWKLVKTAAGDTQAKGEIQAIRRDDGTLATDDKEKADILNKHFATVGQRLADENTPPSNHIELHPVSTVVTTNPTSTALDLVIPTSLVKHIVTTELKSNKATGPDGVSPRLLKFAGAALVPSLTATFRHSAKSLIVPTTWKIARIKAAFKKDDETDRDNYRPLSMLSVPGKIMEKCVNSIINTHMKNNQDLISANQWAYKKGYSTELLLLHMTEKHPYEEQSRSHQR